LQRARRHGEHRLAQPCQISLSHRGQQRIRRLDGGDQDAGLCGIRHVVLRQVTQDTTEAVERRRHRVEQSQQQLVVTLQRCAHDLIVVDAVLHSAAQGCDFGVDGRMCCQRREHRIRSVRWHEAPLRACWSGGCPSVHARSMTVLLASLVAEEGPESCRSRLKTTPGSLWPAMRRPIFFAL
jgi:hypothetical protein